MNIKDHQMIKLNNSNTPSNIEIENIENDTTSSSTTTATITTTKSTPTTKKQLKNLKQDQNKLSQSSTKKRKKLSSSTNTTIRNNNRKLENCDSGIVINDPSSNSNTPPSGSGCSSSTSTLSSVTIIHKKHDIDGQHHLENSGLEQQQLKTNFNYDQLMIDDIDNDGDDNDDINVNICNNNPSSSLPSTTSFTLKNILEFSSFVEESLENFIKFIERFKLILNNIDINNYHKLYFDDHNDDDAKMMTNKTISSTTGSTIGSSSMDDNIHNIITDIDQHLTLLKEIEQRNQIVCESFSKEIRSRDEALLDRMKQINMMNHEMATMQAKLQHLQLKNQQLENEIKYLKTTSSFTNTEASSTPVCNDLERVQLKIHHPQQSAVATNTVPSSVSASQVDEIVRTLGTTIQNKSMTNGPPQPSDHRSKRSINNILDDNKDLDELNGERIPLLDNNGANRTGNNSQKQILGATKNPNQTLPTSVSAYHDILVQYRKIEQLMQQSQMYGRNCSNDVSVLDIGAKLDQSFNATMMDPKASIEPVEISDGSSLNINSKLDDVPIKDGEEGKSSEDPSPETPLTGPFDSGIRSFNPDSGLTTVIGTSPETETVKQTLVDTDDVVATSIKAYEHFVKMQHDLELLMKKENDYRVKIDKLQDENEKLQQQVKDGEFNLSDVQYELDILKHNYDLEIESFSTAINERENLIEKLQQKMRSLKQRYVKLDERFKQSQNTEIELNAKIEELEGRLKYEQLQKQTMIDSRINELEEKLQEQTRDYQLEVQNLKTDLACQVSICKELQQKLDDMDNSMKTMIQAAAATGSSTPEVEDEFLYYKNQIDTMVKELDKQKHLHQKEIDKFEETLRVKDKLLEQCKEQLKKDKDLMLREKTEYEQKYRKMVSKMKSKEQEMKQMQEKIAILNEKFNTNNTANNVQKNPIKQEQESVKNADTENNNNNDQNNDENQKKMTEKKCEEQLLTELTLNEMKLYELSQRLEDYVERYEQQQHLLEIERERRRRLETFYLNSLNNGINDDNDDDIDDIEFGSIGGTTTNPNPNKPNMANIQPTITKQSLNHSSKIREFWDTNHLGTNSNNYHHHHLHSHRRDSQSSLALLMDDVSGSSSQKMMVGDHYLHHNLPHDHNDQCSPYLCFPIPLPMHHPQRSYYNRLKRWFRRQKNILLFGPIRAKLIRLIIIAYFCIIHYMAIGYYYSKPELDISTITNQQQIEADHLNGFLMADDFNGNGELLMENNNGAGVGTEKISSNIIK